MRYAIVGSRTFVDEKLVRKFVRLLPEGSEVVSGGAVGPDSWAASEATKCGLATIVFLPDWDQYGKSAGFRRNQRIVDYCAELVAFWDGKSKGTKHSIDLAERSGKLKHIITRP